MVGTSWKFDIFTFVGGKNAQQFLRVVFSSNCDVVTFDLTMGKFQPGQSGHRGLRLPLNSTED